MKSIEAEIEQTNNLEIDANKLSEQIRQEQETLKILQAKVEMSRVNIVNAISFDKTKLIVILSELISYIAKDGTVVSPFIEMEKDQGEEFLSEVASVLEKDQNGNFQETVQIFRCKFPQIERSIYNFLLEKYAFQGPQRTSYIEIINDYNFGIYDSIIKDFLTYLVEAQYNVGRQLEYEELEVYLQSFLEEKNKISRKRKIK